MKRYIAILTLTAALSPCQTFAIDPGNCVSAISPGDCSSALWTGASNVDDGGSADLYHPHEFDELIAIVAFEYGPEAAYELLLYMGFSDRESDSICHEVLSVFAPNSAEGGSTGIYRQDELEFNPGNGTSALRADELDGANGVVIIGAVTIR